MAGVRWVMAEVKHGTVVVTIADALAPPEQAGKLSVQDVARIPKAPRAVGLGCQHAADAIAKSEGKFTPPAGVTPETLIAAGERADGIDQTIIDLEVVLQTLKQANLIFDAEAYEQLRKVNDQVKAQAKHAPELLTIFQAALAVFIQKPAKKKTEPQPA